MLLTKMQRILSMVLAMVMLVLFQLKAEAAVDVGELRHLAAVNNITCILVFGDSTVDPGNNNHLPTPFKSNFPPYGEDFLQGRPTGRFTNGNLPTDYIAEELGFERAIPPFLDPTLRPGELVHGVSFASAASGYDDLTANYSGVLPFSKQMEYLMHYRIHLKRVVGEKHAKEIVRNAVFIVSAGANDFVLNYYLQTTRRQQFTQEAYSDYLVACLANFIKEMHKQGGRRFVVVGLPPLGCLPLVRTLRDSKDCVNTYNRAAILLNSKIRSKLATLKNSLHLRTAFVDVYTTFSSAMKSPLSYGFAVTSRGCCGTGTYEIGETCKNQRTCSDPSKYVFWDAVHPTDKMYRFIAENAVQSVMYGVAG